MEICFDDPPQSRWPSKKPVDKLVLGSQQAEWGVLYMCTSPGSHGCFQWRSSMLDPIMSTLFFFPDFRFALSSFFFTFC